MWWACGSQEACPTESGGHSIKAAGLDCQGSGGGEEQSGGRGEAMDPGDGWKAELTDGWNAGLGP